MGFLRQKYQIESYSIQNNIISKNVIFEGFVSEKKKSKLFSNSDLFLMPGYIAKKSISKGYELFIQSDSRKSFNARIELGIGNNTLGDKGWNYLTSLSWNPNINLDLDLNYYNAASKEKYHWVEITELITLDTIAHQPIPIIDTLKHDIHYIFSDALTQIKSITGRASINFSRTSKLEVN